MVLKVPMLQVHLSGAVTPSKWDRYAGEADQRAAFGRSPVHEFHNPVIGNTATQQGRPFPNDRGINAAATPF